MSTHTLTEGDDLLGIDPFRYPSDDPGPHTVFALGGNDSIVGGALNDMLYGGEGNDSLAGVQGANLVYGGNGNDYIQFYNEDGSPSGAPAPNYDLLGDQGFGEAGDDVIQFILGGASVAHVGDGGAGLDTLAISFETRIDFNSQMEIIYNRTIDLTNVWTGGIGLVDTGTITNIERITGISGGNGADTIVLGNYIIPINPVSGLPFDLPLLDGNGGNDFISGGNSLDLINGGSGNDTIYGNGGDDFISGGSVFGNSGNDTLYGGAGDDIVSGENGIDRLYGDAGADNLSGNEGNDIIEGGADNDILRGGAGDDIVRGGTGNDNIAEESGANSLYGDEGNDSIAGGADVDTAFGGTDGDFIFGAGGNDRLSGDGGDDLIQGGNGADLNRGGDGNDTLDEVVQDDGANDILYGDAGNDILRGGNGNDVLVGGIGDDSIDGGAGGDEMIGGAGNDIYLAVTGADSVIELASEGIDTVQTSAAVFTLSSNVENLTYTGGAAVFLGLGNASDNNIIGGTGRDQLFGRGGNDVLRDGGGGDGNEDTLLGGTGNDIYIVSVRGDSTIEYSSEGTDEVQTIFSIYSLQANVENLTFTDNAGHGAGIGNILDNVLTGGTGADGLFGREGNDTLRGGAGAANTLLGQEGDDLYIVAATGDSVIESAGQGFDRVQTALSIYTLSANVELLEYTGFGTFTGLGNAGNNLIYGGGLDDFLSASGGNDQLIGGNGADYMIGGDGADRFEYVGGETGADRILDFTSGSDKIALRDAGFAQTANVAVLQGAGAQVANSANSTFLYNSSTGQLFFDVDGNGSGAAMHLANLNTGLTLASGDFLFY